MVKHNITEIINDEISNFDFLGNDEFLKEQEIVDLLSNEELQKQFISDSLLNKNDRVKIEKIDNSNIINNQDELDTEDNHLKLQYSIDIQYQYDSDKKPLNFNLNFDSDKIDIKDNNIDWSDIDVSIYTTNGDEIDFKSFKNAPENIQTSFIQEYVQDFVQEEIKVNN